MIEAIVCSVARSVDQVVQNGVAWRITVDFGFIVKHCVCLFQKLLQLLEIERCAARRTINPIRKCERTWSNAAFWSIFAAVVQ